MPSLKLIFSGDATTKITSKKINEDKYNWFIKLLEELPKSDYRFNIKIYRGTRLTKKVYMSESDYMKLFKAWFDYK